MRTRVTTITCPICGVEMYSRARHDARFCKCGTMVDGGFDYLHLGWPNGHSQPKTRVRYITATRKQLYDDWNKRMDKFGIIAARGAK